MRFLLDTNILLHAANAGSSFHEPAKRFLDAHLRQRTHWSTTWPILYEFLRVSTHARVFPKPLKAAQALDFVRVITALEEVSILGPTDRHVELLAELTAELTLPSGNLFHDIHTVVLMREHGIAEIVTADTDFLQFRALRVTNPLLPAN